MPSVAIEISIDSQISGGGLPPLDENEFYITATEDGVTYDATATEDGITYDASATEEA
jgi:hypothetical protein